MCRFKSGIILRNKCVVAQGENNSHSDLLDSMGIEDTMENAMRVFVRAELLPPDNKWWTDPDTWEFVVDQDITPDWYNEDRERYIAEFREAVKSWWLEHVFVDKEIEELTNGYYYLKRCRVRSLTNVVKVLCDDSIIWEMRHNSCIIGMYGNSIVDTMWDDSIIQIMCDNSTVGTMYNNSGVCDMFDTSTIQEMFHLSTVGMMHDSSSINLMRDNSTVSMMAFNSVVNVMTDNSTIRKMHDHSIVREIHKNGIARNLRDGTILISSESKLRVTIFENPESGGKTKCQRVKSKVISLLRKKIISRGQKHPHGMTYPHKTPDLPK